jgi:hypothetical protein
MTLAKPENGGASRLYASETAKWDNQTMFEFHACSYTAPPYQGKGSVDTWQGFITTAKGHCLTISELEGQGAVMEAHDCIYDAGRPAGVRAAQHFQFQLDSFYSFYSANFLGKAKQPSDTQDFGAGGNYHFNLAPEEDRDDSRLVLTANFLSQEPQEGDLGEMLIGQLGTQYHRPPKQFPECRLVKRGAVELVNRKTGKAFPVTVHGDNYNTYDKVPVLNGTQSYAGFGFYQCDSEYMGYTSDNTNYYGHLTIEEDESEGYCFARLQGESGAEDAISSQYVYGGGCGTTEDSSQLQTFFHLSVTDTAYEIEFLGQTSVKADAMARILNAEQNTASGYGWTTHRVVQGTEYNSNEVWLNPGHNATAPDYVLRFVH